jgi:hypothetical protein
MEHLLLTIIVINADGLMRWPVSVFTKKLIIILLH